MDSVVVIAIIAVFLAGFLIRRPGPWRRQKLPPGPYPFPIIGNILQLGRQPHQSLANLSKSYGPLMSLQLGCIYTVVVSSPEAAKLVLQANDRAFSGRTVPAAAEVHGFDKISVGLIPVGDKWRKLRKLIKEQMFSTRRLEAGEGLRREKVEKLLEYVHKCSINGRAVNLGEAAFVTGINLLGVTFFSLNLAEFDSDDAQLLKETVVGFAKVLGTPNVADFFPFFKRFDPQGIKKQTELYVGKMLDIVQGIINTRLESRSSVNATTRKNDLLDTLLDNMEGGEYNLSFREIQQLFLDLLFGGSDTAPSTVEWAMTELLVNPEKMVKAKNEVRNAIGSENKVEESDISRLPYLRALIKETLRLHPPAPFLIPHRADRDVEISGYTIPENAQIFVNVWAIGRDSSIWANPSSFEPERFLDSKIEFKGQDFEYLPFGSGRRVCPGLALADRVLPLVVGSLIHKFDWKVEEGEEVDTAEEFGMALHKALPLKAIPLTV